MLQKVFQAEWQTNVSAVYIAKTFGDAMYHVAFVTAATCVTAASCAILTNSNVQHSMQCKLHNY